MEWVPASSWAHTTIHQGISGATNTAQLTIMENIMWIFTNNLIRIEHSPWSKYFGFLAFTAAVFYPQQFMHHSTDLILPVYNLVTHLWKDYPHKLMKFLNIIFHGQMSKTDQGADSHQHFYAKWTSPMNKIHTHCCQTPLKHRLRLCFFT